MPSFAIFSLQFRWVCSFITATKCPPGLEGPPSRSPWRHQASLCHLLVSQNSLLLGTHLMDSTPFQSPQGRPGPSPPAFHPGPAQVNRTESGFTNPQDPKPVPLQRKLQESSQTKAPRGGWVNELELCRLHTWERECKYLTAEDFPTYMEKTLCSPTKDVTIRLQTQTRAREIQTLQNSVIFFKKIGF